MSMIADALKVAQEERERRIQEMRDDYDRLVAEGRLCPPGESTLTFEEWAGQQGFPVRDTGKQKTTKTRTERIVVAAAILVAVAIIGGVVIYLSSPKPKPAATTATVPRANATMTVEVPAKDTTPRMTTAMADSMALVAEARATAPAAPDTTVVAAKPDTTVARKPSTATVATTASTPPVAEPTGPLVISREGLYDVVATPTGSRDVILSRKLAGMEVDWIQGDENTSCFGVVLNRFKNTTACPGQPFEHVGQVFSVNFKSLSTSTRKITVRVYKDA